MSEEKEQRRLGRLIIIFAIMPAVIIIGTGCKKRPAEPTRTEQHQNEPAQSEPVSKPAPDFTLADLTGKEHKLSDYRGKNVLLVFWATWCQPCRREIPGLIELRKTVGEDNLAILAISDEKLDLVKKFVTDQKMNYTVLLDKGNMPKPFGVMRIYTTTGIPGSFFINPEGKIKLATSGLISFGEIKAVLQAP